MSNFTLEQSRVVSHVDGDILVSASAGSGKTYTIIERVKKLVIEKKAKVSEILAVTFTEMAAAEMKEKLKDALVKEIERTNSYDLSEELNQVGVADISTLHSFCGKIIRSYFFEAGVNPDFKILDETDSAVIKNHCVNMAFKEFYDKGEEWFLSLVDKHARGRRDDNLKELITSAYAFSVSEAQPKELLDLYKKHYTDGGKKSLLEEYKRYLNERITLLQKIALECADRFGDFEFGKGVQFAEQLIKTMQTVIDSESIWIFDTQIDFPRWVFGKMPEQIEEHRELLKNCRNQFKSILLKAKKTLEVARMDSDSLLMAHTSDFIRVLDRFFEIYKKEKEEENALDFNDLEHLALKVLYNEEIRKEIKERYKFIFVDEYQDTNGVQEEILSMVGNDNILMVGDVKQSIYGFRGCRPEIFIDKQKKMESDNGTVVRLNENFRSAKAVINAVNQVFNYCMTEELFGENYKDRSQLVFGGGYPDGKDGRAELHFLKKEKDSGDGEEVAEVYDVIKRVKDSRDDKDNPVAALVADVINKELENTYYDPKEKVDKPIQLSDIAILTRSRESEHVRSLVRGLNARGISVISDVKENVCDFPEIKVLISALKIVDCFNQDVPLAMVLKSVIGGFSDDDLMDIADFYYEETGDKKNGFYTALNYYMENADTPLSDKLKEFCEYFDHVRFLSDFIGAEGVLEKIVNDKDVEAYLLADSASKTRLYRLKRFISASKSGGAPLTVGEFLNKIEQSSDAFGFSDSGANNAVKLMTVHKSKGLEFPVVIVCGLERGFNVIDESAEIIFSREKGLGFKYYDQEERVVYDTLLRSVIAEQKHKQMIQEEMRLFYVAMTRATYSLHLTCWAGLDSRTDTFCGAKRFMDFVPRSMIATVHESVFGLSSISSQRRQVIIGKGDDKLQEEFNANFNYVYPYLEETTLPLKSNVTVATKATFEDGEITYVLFDEGHTDIERGNIAHKILEHLDFSNISEYLEQVDKMVLSGIISDTDKQKIDHDRIRVALTSDAFKSLNGYTLYREKGFMTEIEAHRIMTASTNEKVLLQGVIDLLALSESDARIIDYKYSSLTKDGLEKKYKKQLELYSYAVEKLLGKKVIERTIVNLYTGETVKV